MEKKEKAQSDPRAFSQTSSGSCVGDRPSSEITASAEYSVFIIDSISKAVFEIYDITSHQIHLENFPNTKRKINLARLF